VNLNYRKAYLWVSAVGLLPVAFSYGVAPEISLDWLYGIAVQAPNEAHIFRAIMGLYLAMVALWVLGATQQRFERPAIIGEVVFMSGLAAGRLLSVLLDGWPHWLLVGFIAVEVTLAIAGIVLLKQSETPAE
jgi:hypothetical protein